MSPGTPHRTPGEERLLVVDAATGAIEEAPFRALPRAFGAGDLVVVNDAATLPASIPGRARGTALEIRLASEREDGAWEAVLFGPGDWRTRTEDRAAPARLDLGERVDFPSGLAATIAEVSPLSPRLVALRFDAAGDALFRALYRVGRPVQYAHLRAPLELREVQTRFAGRPWAVEMPSAGRPLTWDLVERLRRAGVALASVTHAAGLSSTGDPAIDAALPLPERFEIPAATVAAIGAARERGGRVVAVGTTVVRALEGSAARSGGVLLAGGGVTDLRIDGRFVRRVVDSIVTGVHEPGTSHHALLHAFAPAQLVERALAAARERGFLAHEFGDAMLFCAARAARRRPHEAGRAHSTNASAAWESETALR